MKLFPFCSSSKFLHTIRLFSSSVHFLLIMVWTLLCSVRPILFAAGYTTFTLASPHNGVAWNRRTMVLLEIAAQWCCLKSPHNGVAWNRLFWFISPIKCVVSRTGCQSMQSCLALWIRLILTGVASFHQVLFQTNLNQDHPPPHQHN